MRPMKWDEAKLPRIKFKEGYYSRPLRITFAGDIMQHGKQLEYEKTNGYAGVFDHIKEFLVGDMVIGNLETVFAGTDEIDPNNGAPIFSAHDSLAVALRRAGFTHIAICNNHMYDHGLEGLNRTVKVLKDAGLTVLGTRNEFIIRENKINIVNFTTHLNGDEKNEFENKGYIEFNQIPNANPECTLNIAIPHWGGQYNPQEDKEQVKFATKLQENGFDIIVGSGPHVPHRIEVKNNKIIAYSLGDFLSDHQNSAAKDSGLILQFKLDDGEFATRTIHTSTAADNGKSFIQYSAIEIKQ